MIDNLEFPMVVLLAAFNVENCDRDFGATAIVPLDDLAQWAAQGWRIDEALMRVEFVETHAYQLTEEAATAVGLPLVYARTAEEARRVVAFMMGVAEGMEVAGGEAAELEDEK